MLESAFWQWHFTRHGLSEWIRESGIMAVVLVSGSGRIGQIP